MNWTYFTTQCAAVNTCCSLMSDPPQNWRPALKSAAIHGHSPGSAFCPPTIRSWSWLPFLVPHCDRLLLPLEIGDLLVVDVLDKTGHQVGFLVGHVVAIPGFFELVVIGFKVVVDCVGRPDEGGWVGSGGIVWSGGCVGIGGGQVGGAAWGRAIPLCSFFFLLSSIWIN